MKNKKTMFRMLVCFLITVITVGNLYAQPNKGYEIMKKYDELKEPKDSYSEGRLVLENKKGNVKKREMLVYSKKQAAGYDSFFEITKPADVAGMRFLTIAQKGDDDQRMYLPAFGKSRKISGSGKDGKFLGSDLYFYDLEDHDLEDFTYKYIKEDEWDGKAYYVVESYPVDKDAPYSKLTNWVRKDDYYVYKIEMYDKKQGRLIKTSFINEIEIIDGIITPLEMEIINHLDNHKTMYYQGAYKINVGIDDDVFTVQNLEK